MQAPNYAASGMTIAPSYSVPSVSSSSAASMTASPHVEGAHSYAANSHQPQQSGTSTPVSAARGLKRSRSPSHSTPVLASGSSNGGMRPPHAVPQRQASGHSYASSSSMNAHDGSGNAGFAAGDTSGNGSGADTPGSRSSPGSKSSQSLHQNAGGSGSQQDAAAAAAAQQAADDAAAKRIKTPRACDSCRRKKIRCDIIDGLNLCVHCKTYNLECTFYLPISETRFKKKRDRERELEEAAAVQQHQHHHLHQVHQHQQQQQHLPPFPNPFQNPGARFLPPLRAASSSEWMRAGQPAPGSQAPTSSASAAAAAVAAAGQPFGFPHWQQQQQQQQQGPQSSQQGQPSFRPPGAGPLLPPLTPPVATMDHNATRTTKGPAAVVALHSGQHRAASDSTAGRPGSASPRSASGGGPRSAASGAEAQPPPPDSSVLGPTSIAYLVHSTAFVPSAALEDHDIRHHQTFEIGASGDGIIKFHKMPRPRNTSTTSSSDEDLAAQTLELPEVVRSRLAGDVAEKLANSYFEKIAPLFPIITKSEFLHLSPPPPLLLYAVCSVAALSRDVPREVLTAVRVTLAQLLRDSDILSNSSSIAVRALLVMSINQDVHGSGAVQCGARSWNRLGCAIRMAQDLGLHRDAGGRDDVDDDAFFLEQKRRIWGSCVTADRWASIFSGRPLAIDLTDCDGELSPLLLARAPSLLISDRSSCLPEQCDYHRHSRYCVIRAIRPRDLARSSPSSSTPRCSSSAFSSAES